MVIYTLLRGRNLEQYDYRIVEFNKLFLCLINKNHIFVIMPAIALEAYVVFVDSVLWKHSNTENYEWCRWGLLKIGKTLSGFLINALRRMRKRRIALLVVYHRCVNEVLDVTVIDLCVGSKLRVILFIFDPGYLLSTSDAFLSAIHHEAAEKT